MLHGTNVHACCTCRHAAPPTHLWLRPLPTPLAASALLSLPSATSNWDAATADVNGAAWQAGSNPCGSGGSGAWKGVTCGGGGAAADAVTQLQLPRLGLQGTLPGQLAQLPSLALLDLSGNAFEGSIPEAWLQPEGFPSLTTALLGGNKLGGACRCWGVCVVANCVSCRCCGCFCGGISRCKLRSGCIDH